MFVFGRVQIHSGHRVDPTKMIVNRLDALDVLGRNDGCLS